MVVTNEDNVTLSWMKLTDSRMQSRLIEHNNTRTLHFVSSLRKVQGLTDTIDIV